MSISSDYRIGPPITAQTTPAFDWQVVAIGDRITEIENSKYSLAESDEEGFVEVTISNNSASSDDYPSRMPGFVINPKFNGDNVFGPFPQNACLMVRITISEDSNPSTADAFNTYIGICNAEGVPADSDMGMFIGWRKNVTGYWALITDKSVEGGDSIVGELKSIEGIIFLRDSRTPGGIAIGVDNSGNATDCVISHTKSGTSATDDFKIFIGIGLEAVTRPTPIVVKVKWEYSFVYA